jgi:hypothetical protein
MHPGFLRAPTMEVGRGDCFTPRAFIECADQTSCGLAVGGQCRVSPATGHQFCAYPDTGCTGGVRWSDYDVEATINGTCVQPGQGADAGIDAPPPVCADLGCTPLWTFCTDTGCTCTPPGGIETACVRGPGAAGGVDAQPRDAGTGFRTTPAAPPRVLIGSANLLSRAVGPDSGELGVWVDGGDAAAEAWNALEAFWSEGDRITPAWLSAYEKQHAAIAARRAAVEARVPKPRRRNDLERPTAVPDALYVKVSSWMSEGRAAELDEAAEAQGVELPEECYESTEAEARRLREVSPFLDLTFDGARLNLVSLISTGEPFPFRETRRSAPVWLVPWKVVRGSTLAFRDRDFPRIATIFDKHRLGGWLQNPTEGFLGARRSRLLQCLADLGWKPAKEPTTKSKAAPRVR